MIHWLDAMQPVQLDYIEVVHSVCDLLSAFYDRLLALPAELPITTYQNIHTIDSHITVREDWLAGRQTGWQTH